MVLVAAVATLIAGVAVFATITPSPAEARLKRARRNRTRQDI